MFIDPGEFDTLVRIERPVADAAFDGAGSGDWALVDEVWIGIRDMLPSRGERLADGINVTTRPARIRMRYRDDVSTEMRIVAGDRILQIVAGPAELGRRQWMEFVAEEYRPAGNPA